MIIILLFAISLSGCYPEKNIIKEKEEMIKEIMVTSTEKAVVDDMPYPDWYPQTILLSSEEIRQKLEIQSNISFKRQNIIERNDKDV